MSKSRTTNGCFDDLCKISIADLKQHGLLPPSDFSSETISYRGSGETLEEIKITVRRLGSQQGYIEFEHPLNEDGVSLEYRVFLKCVPSNLGKGYIWYFVAPKTHKLCRVLYLVNNVFSSRDSVAGVLYKSQSGNKRSRIVRQLLLAEEKGEGIRTHYKGIPTKRYVRWKAKIERLQASVFTELE